MATLGINRVLVVGWVGKYDVTLRQQGSECASFLLAVPECGKDGKTYMTRIPIEIWGKHAQEAATLTASQLVLVEGRLRKRKRSDEEWELMVSGFEAVPVGLASNCGDPRQPSLF
jgi:single-stranded DNA-binding protein